MLNLGSELFYSSPPLVLTNVTVVVSDAIYVIAHSILLERVCASNRNAFSQTRRATPG